MLSVLAQLVPAVTMLYAPGFCNFAEYYGGLAGVVIGAEAKVLADTSAMLPESGVRYYFGTPRSSYYRDAWETRLSFSYSGDTVFLADSFLAADDYVLRCGVVGTAGDTWELVICRVPEAVTGMGSRYGHDFTLTRQRDGVMYQRDITAFGTMQAKGLSYVISEIHWQQHPPRPLASVSSGRLVLKYDSTFVRPDEAVRMARLGSVICRSYVDIGIVLPDSIVVIVTQDASPTGGYSVYSNPFNTIWWRFADRDAMIRPRPPSCPVYTFGHELARVALQPLSDEYPVGLGADDWSHFGPMILGARAAWTELGDSAWLRPYDYLSAGPQRFLRWYSGTKTYAWLLHEVAGRYGVRLVGEAARRTMPSRTLRMPQMADFMRCLVELTGDSDLVRRAAEAYPTPFEHSLMRAAGWRDHGLRPNLDRMFIDGDFRVDSVVVGSPSDSVGFRSGDVVTLIDGFAVPAKMADCKRHLLKLPAGVQLEFVVKRSGHSSTMVMRR